MIKIRKITQLTHGGKCGFLTIKKHGSEGYKYILFNACIYALRIYSLFFNSHIYYIHIHIYMVTYCSPKLHVYLEPVNVTLFGSLSSSDIIRLGIAKIVFTKNQVGGVTLPDELIYC